MEEVTANPVEVPKKSNKTTIILIISGCVLLLCCVITIVVVGYFVMQNLNKSVIIDTEIPTPTSEEPVNPTQTEVPSLSTVQDEYLGTLNYHFSGELYTDEVLTLSFSGEFVVPGDDHYTTVEEFDGYTTEEYAIEGVYYIKGNDGAWIISDTPYNSTVQRTQLVNFFNNAPVNTVGVDEDDFFTYFFDDTANEEQVKLWVNKETNYPAKMEIHYTGDSGEAIVEQIIYSSYNDPAISLEAPLVSP